MDSEELNTLRSELLRQKVVFAAELRRQREEFEERLDGITQALAERDADCRNLQAVVTILGKKLDIFSRQLHEQKARATPLRRTSSNRRPSLSYLLESSFTNTSPGRGKKSANDGVSTPEKEPHRPQVNPPDTLRLNVISSLKSLSRTSSPFNDHHSREDSREAVVSARAVNEHHQLFRTSTKTSNTRSETTRRAEKKIEKSEPYYRNTTDSRTHHKTASVSQRSSKVSTRL